LYRIKVAGDGRDEGVREDTTNMSRAEINVIGTTGSSPRTVVPDATRLTTSTPPSESTATDAPGPGAGTDDWRIATPATAAAVHSATARAPHLVLFCQKRVAIKSGESAE
jgi:hypothetical protein